jgi:hypothetical protein
MFVLIDQLRKYYHSCLAERIMVGSLCSVLFVVHYLRLLGLKVFFWFTNSAWSSCSRLCSKVKLRRECFWAKIRTRMPCLRRGVGTRMIFEYSMVCSVRCRVLKFGICLCKHLYIRPMSFGTLSFSGC